MLREVFLETAHFGISLCCGVFSVMALLTDPRENKRREENDNHNYSPKCALYLFDLRIFITFFQILAPAGIVLFYHLVLLFCWLQK